MINGHVFLTHRKMRFLQGKRGNGFVVADEIQIIILLLLQLMIPLLPFATP